MADINENIVKLYFELEGYFVHQNLKYWVRKKTGAGESDIDLAIYRSSPLDRAIIEVKGWHTETFSRSYFLPDFNWRLFNFMRPEATKEATRFFKSNKFRKILVVTRLSPNSRDEIIKACHKKGLEILEFDTILKKIIEKTEENIDYKHSEFQQAIRLMKVYGYLKEEK